VSGKNFTRLCSGRFARISGLQGVVVGPPRPDAQREAYEEALRLGGAPDFQITERDAAGHWSGPPGALVCCGLLHRALAENERALGFDVASMPNRLEPCNGARDTPPGGSPAPRGGV